MPETPTFNMQSSCTKRAVEVESPQRVPLSDQIADPPDSTCAQVIHPNPETFCNDWVPHPASGECQGQKEPTGMLHLNCFKNSL